MNGGRLIRGFRRSGQAPAETKQSPLNLFGPRLDIRVAADAASKAKDRVELIHRAVRFDAQVCLRYPNSAYEARLPGVARLGGNAHRVLHPSDQSSCIIGRAGARA